MIHWRWGQREKGEKTFSAAELGMRLSTLDLEEQKERCGSAVLLFAVLERTALGIEGAACWGCGRGQCNELGEGGYRRGRSVRSTRDGNRGL